MKKIFTLIGLSFLVAGSVSAQIVPTLTVTTTNATNCTAPCNGTATLVTGGITGATYLWSTTPAQTTATATGLCPGVYTCTVTLSVIGSSTGTGTVTCTSTGINEIAVVGANAKEIVREFKIHYLPNKLFLAGTNSELPLLKDKQSQETKIYICRNKACQLPVSTVNEALKLITK